MIFPLQILSAPDGWVFSPEEIEVDIDGSGSDACSKGEDIDFRLVGFQLRGRVVNKEKTEVPVSNSDIEIDLLDSSNKETLMTTKTLSDGSYLFNGVAPGEYTVRVAGNSMKIFSFEADAIKVSYFLRVNHCANSKQIFSIYGTR